MEESMVGFTIRIIFDAWNHAWGAVVLRPQLSERECPNTKPTSCLPILCSNGSYSLWHWDDLPDWTRDYRVGLLNRMPKLVVTGVPNALPEHNPWCSPGWSIIIIIADLIRNRALEFDITGAGTDYQVFCYHWASACTQNLVEATKGWPLPDDLIGSKPS